MDLFPDRVEQDKLDKIRFSASTEIQERGSTFTAYALKVQPITEVKRAYNRLKQLNPSATHIVAAYNIKNGEGYADDREYGASYRALGVLSTHRYNNVALFTVRYHNGDNLGPRRHQIMQKVQMEALARIKKFGPGTTGPT